MNKRYTKIRKIIYVLFMLIILKLCNIQIIKNAYYKEELDTLTQKLIQSNSTPRGRIYDRNGILLVDNKPIKTIYYKKEKGITIKEEIDIAYKLSKMIDIDYSLLTHDNIKKFWIINNNEIINSRITEDEWNLLSLRKITKKDIEKFKMERVTDSDIKDYTNEDKKAIYIYTLMNDGYSYIDKVIKNKNVTDLE